MDVGCQGGDGSSMVDDQQCSLSLRTIMIERDVLGLGEEEKRVLGLGKKKKKKDSLIDPPLPKKTLRS